jgi:hypothetical protein
VGRDDDGLSTDLMSGVWMDSNVDDEIGLISLEQTSFSIIEGTSLIEESGEQGSVDVSKDDASFVLEDFLGGVKAQKFCCRLLDL